MDLKKIKNSNHLYGITKDVSGEQWQEWLVCHCLQRTNVKGLGGSTGSTVLVWINWELLVLKSELCSLLNLKLNFAKCWWDLRALKLIRSRIHPWPWAVFCSTVWHMTQVLKNRYNEAAGFFYHLICSCLGVHQRNERLQGHMFSDLQPGLRTVFRDHWFMSRSCCCACDQSRPDLEFLQSHLSYQDSFHLSQTQQSVRLAVC